MAFLITFNSFFYRLNFVIPRSYNFFSKHIFLSFLLSDYLSSFSLVPSHLCLSVLLSLLIQSLSPSPSLSLSLSLSLYIYIYIYMAIPFFALYTSLSICPTPSIFFMLIFLKTSLLYSPSFLTLNSHFTLSQRRIKLLTLFSLIIFSLVSSGVHFNEKVLIQDLKGTNVTHTFMRVKKLFVTFLKQG